MCLQYKHNTSFNVHSSYREHHVCASITSEIALYVSGATKLWLYLCSAIAYKSYHQSFTKAMRDYKDKLLLSVCACVWVMRSEQNIATKPKTLCCTSYTRNTILSCYITRIEIHDYLFKTSHVSLKGFYATGSEHFKTKIKTHDRN